MREHQDPTPAALYARVSSDRQDVDLSISAQLRALRDHAEKNGYAVVREYVDEAESGRIADRPEFSKMIDEAKRVETPFRVILVWKFSRFTRKREHAVAFKALLKRNGIRVVSITEPADDSPTGKLMESLIECIDEFYSDNLGQEVSRGMREAASRGFWMTTYSPYGFKRIYVQDGAKERPKLHPDPATAPTVRRMFDLAESGKSVLDIARALNDEGVASPWGKQWSKTGVYNLLVNEAYKGTVVWGKNAKDDTPPIRVDDAFEGIVFQAQFDRVAKLLKARAPAKVHPRRVGSSYLLSGIVKCKKCRRSLTGQDSKSGKFSYYVCQSLLKRGKGACNTPRLNARRFERTVVDNICSNILTEGNIRKLVRIVNDEMDDIAHEHGRKLEAIQGELAEVRRKLDRLYRAIETTDLDISDIAPRVREHRDRERKLQDAAMASEARLSERRMRLDDVETIAAYAKDIGVFLNRSELTERKAFLASFVKEISVSPDKARIRYSMPIPSNSQIGTRYTEDVAISESVRTTVKSGGPAGIRTQDTRIKSPML